MIIEFSRKLSSHAICTSVSLAITAHELSLSLSSSLNTYYILINGGIDIYYIHRMLMERKRRRSKKIEIEKRKKERGIRIMR